MSHSCSYCNIKFRLQEQKKEHEMTHTGSKPYSCDMCDRKYSRKEQFNVHKRTHTGEKPFLCSICGLKFADKSNRRKHEKSHTAESKQERPISSWLPPKFSNFGLVKQLAASRHLGRKLNAREPKKHEKCHTAELKQEESNSSWFTPKIYKEPASSHHPKYRSEFFGRCIIMVASIRTQNFQSASRRPDQAVWQAQQLHFVLSGPKKDKQCQAVVNQPSIEKERGNHQEGYTSRHL